MEENTLKIKLPEICEILYDDNTPTAAQKDGYLENIED